MWCAGSESLAAENLFNRGQQGVEVERLGQGADTEFGQHFLVLSQRLNRRGADDRGNVLCRRVERQQVQDRPTVLFAADANVQNDQVGLFLFDELIGTVPFFA